MVRISSMIAFLATMAIGVQAGQSCQCLNPDGSHCCVSTSVSLSDLERDADKTDQIFRAASMTAQRSVRLLSEFSQTSPAMLVESGLRSAGGTRSSALHAMTTLGLEKAWRFVSRKEGRLRCENGEFMRSGLTMSLVFTYLQST